MSVQVFIHQLVNREAMILDPMEDGMSEEHITNSTTSGLNDGIRLIGKIYESYETMGVDWGLSKEHKTKAQITK